jgi:hypothetical protein
MISAGVSVLDRRDGLDEYALVSAIYIAMAAQLRGTNPGRAPVARRGK